MSRMPFSMEGKSANSAADQSMHFWGICCESGKQYAQVVGQRFRITMAVLDPKSSSKSGDRTVSLIVIRGGVEYLLCVLKHEEIHQVNLNLIFDKGENVIFYINGYGKVYLSGYQLTDSENDVLNDENGYLCPLVEVKFTETKAERKGRLTKTPVNAASDLVTPRSKKKLEADKNDLATSDKKKKGDGNRYATEAIKLEDLEFDDESESDDEDFQIEDVEDESESESDEESLESEDDSDSDEELEEIVFTKKSQKKRKLENISQPPKRSRVDSGNTSSADDKSENAVGFGDNGSKDSSDSDILNSSIGNTPMPKKQNAMEKKKAKKKKRLSEISMLSEKSVKGQKSPGTPGTESTPNKKTDNAVKKLEGGVEVQDVIVGKGPEARTGKMVHVFYVGRLQNKQIFDSRVPGKKPFSFKLGTQQVIKGWDIGIQGMKVGGKRKLKIPPNMAYGNSKIESIPPNSTLFFIVELQAVS